MNNKRTAFLLGLLVFATMGALLPNTVQSLTTYDTVADAVAFHNPAGYFKSLHVRGYLTVGDGGGGDFVVVSGITSTNLGTKFKLALGGGTYSMQRRESGPYTLNQFGAFDGASCDAALGSWDGLTTTYSLRVPKGAYLINTNASWSVHKKVRMDPEAKFQIASGISLTINGMFEADSHQVFTGAGFSNVVFGIDAMLVGDAVNPVWWGAVDTATATDSAPAMEAAQFAVTSLQARGLKIQVPSGQFWILTPMALRAGAHFVGAGAAYTRFVGRWSGSQSMFTYDQGGESIIEDIRFSNAQSSGSSTNVAITVGTATGGLAKLTLHRCMFDLWTRAAVILRNSGYSIIDECYFLNNQNASGTPYFGDAATIACDLMLGGETTAAGKTNYVTAFKETRSKHISGDQAIRAPYFGNISLRDGSVEQMGARLGTNAPSTFYFGAGTLDGDGGGGLVISGYYMEGNYSTTNQGLIHLGTIYGAEISGCQFTTHYGSATTRSVNTILNENTMGLSVHGNVFSGTSQFFILNASPYMVWATPNAWLQANTTNRYATFAALSPFMSGAVNYNAGTDGIVFGTPLYKPTISDFTNAGHNHQNAAGGGTLTFSALPTRTLTAGAGLSGGGDLSADRTFTLDGSTFVSNFTMWDASQASRTWTANLSGATDPVWTYGNNSADLTTGVLKYGGNTVATAANNISFLASSTSANLASNISDETGSSGGVAVFSNGPNVTNAVLVTPTIASFANANHTHQDSAGGGTLDPAALVNGGAFQIPWWDPIQAKTIWVGQPLIESWLTGNSAGMWNWTSDTANSGSGALSAGDAGHWSLFQLTTGSLTNGAFSKRLNNAMGFFNAQTNRLIMWINTPAALSSDTDGYQLFLGFTDGATAEATDGAYFTYTHSLSSGNWVGRTSNNSTRTDASGGSNVAVTANAWWCLRIDAHSSGCRFYVATESATAGVPNAFTYIGQSTANIPTTSARATMIGYTILKTGPSPGGTTSRTLSLWKTIYVPAY